MANKLTAMDGKEYDYVTLAFFRAAKSGIIGKLIAWWTKTSKGTDRFHSELIFSDGMSFSSQEKEYDGIPEGVRFKHISYTNPSQWSFIKFPLLEPESAVRARAESKVGNGYDWSAIWLSQFLHLGVDDKGKEFCSEVDAFALGFDPFLMSPNELADKAMERRIELNVLG